MDKNIIFLCPGSNKALRMTKIASVLKEKGYNLYYIGWPRSKEANCNNDALFVSSEAVLVGGGEANSKLPFLYIVFIIKLFFKLLFKRGLKNDLVFCINFETAFAAWAASHFKRISYIYDIWDELALSHSFPKWIVRLLQFFDRKIRKRAYLYIHVDRSRYSSVDDRLINSIIIYNSPSDFFNGSNPPMVYDKSFAITGWLNTTRGLQSIYDFAIKQPSYKFIVAGKFLQKEMESKFLSLSNVEHYDFMPQKELFKIISSCRGIFSLYDDRIPINRLAASNKLYDAMMLGIPVIVNEGLVAAKMVKDNNLGFVISYDFNSSWEVLSSSDDNTIKAMGISGRKLYLQDYEFVTMCEKNLLPKIANFSPFTK